MKVTNGILHKYVNALKEDPTWFDEADSGYFPHTMVKGYDDVYLCKGSVLKDFVKEEYEGEEQTSYYKVVMQLKDDSYYLDFCWEQEWMYEIDRDAELLSEIRIERD